MALQITSLMWLRTIMNFQYRYGLSMREATHALYTQGGIRRFYQGISPALVQGPLMRFGDSASNAGVLAFFGATNREDVPVWFQTIFASASAASIRIALMPVDAVKTVLQVDGKQGLSSLLRRFHTGGSSVLFRGAMASSAATFVSHYPWFTVFNQLNDFLPHYDSRSQQLLRNASIGFSASVVSDTVSNSLR
ncbi:Mpped1, partial [Symbiodinium sp. CCMP2456]